MPEQRPKYELPATGFVRLSQLVPHIIPMGRSTVWLKVKQGEFPQPVKLSARITAWRAEDIRAWIASRSPQGEGNRICSNPPGKH